MKTFNQSVVQEKSNRNGKLKRLDSPSQGDRGDSIGSQNLNTTLPVNQSHSLSVH